jgi:hypothetical protein
LKTRKNSISIALVLLIILTACPRAVRAQAYIPMLNGYSEWHITNCYFGCATDKYYTIGDTVINLQHYTFLDKYHYNKNFLIREDTVNRKVYMRMLADTGTPKEYLLYDFSVHVSDTVSIQNPGSPYPKYAGSFVVDSVILRPLVNKSHRYFYLHSLDTAVSLTKNTIWVEGIGSLCLINTPGALPQINGVAQLSCFFHNGVNEYAQLDSIADCSPVYPLNVRNLFSAQSFTLSQNPGSEQIFIKASGGTAGFKIYIYNTAGKTELYYEENDTEALVSTSGLSKGLLLLRLETIKGTIATYKIFNP